MKYSKKPEKIKLKKSESKYCVCNNCFDTNYVYKITLNETNFVLKFYAEIVHINMVLELLKVMVKYIKIMKIF